MVAYEITEESLFNDAVHNFVDELLLLHHSLDSYFILEKTLMRPVIIDRNVVDEVGVNFA